MANRNLLHINRLDDFKLWLDQQGVEHRPGRGQYEVLQVQVVKPFWCVIYRRDSMPEHYTVPSNLTRTVLRFLHEKSAAPEPITITSEETAPCPDNPPWPT